MAAARPGSFTGATDDASAGGLFGDTLIDGIPDIVGADVAAAQAAATAAAASEANASTSENNAATSETNAATSETNAANSATAAATSATAAATSASTTAADAATATTQAAAALTSATNAAASQTAASNSATSAATSATQATASQNTALSSASAAGNSATAAATSETNSATSETNAATSATDSATSAAAALVSENNAATSETNAATSATNSATSATASATSATASATSAAAALVSENNAATSETNAATSESNASTSETNAAASATAALASENAAAGYVDEFDDRYLGAKTSDPTLDNDGNALTDGALYYNTTVDRMKVYDLSTTSWLFISPTAAEQTNIDTVATDITNVNTVATNILDVNNFADTYFISSTAPTSPTQGDLWFDTDPDSLIMKVYDGSNFVNAGSSVNGTAERVTYTATAGQTSFAATYDAGFVDVYLNGIKLIDGSDFTATSGSAIVLSSGAALNDTVDIVAYGTFELLNTVLNDLSDVSTAGATSGQVLSYNGASWAASTPSVPTLSSLGIDNHDELTVDASGNVTVSGTFTSQGIDDNATSTAMTLDASGNLLVGTTTTVIQNGTTAGTIINSTGQIEAARNGNVIGLNRLSTDGAVAIFQKDGTTVGSIDVSSGDNLQLLGSATDHAGLEFGTNLIIPKSNGASADGAIDLGLSTVRFKDTYLSGGIYLGGTGSANYLDDYEEGTWNPTTFSGWTTNPVLNSATYTRIGRLVMVTIFFASGVSNADARFTNGLPFTVDGQGTGVGVTGGIADFGHVMISSSNTWFTNDGGNFANTRWSATYTTSA